MKNESTTWRQMQTICLSDFDVQESLISLNKVLPMRKLLIITKDEEREITKNGITIEVIPICKWLL